MITDASRQVWGALGRYERARPARRLDDTRGAGRQVEVCPSRDAKQEVAGILELGAGEALEWKVTTKCCAAPAPTCCERGRGTSCPGRTPGDWCVVPPSSALPDPAVRGSQKGPARVGTGIGGSSRAALVENRRRVGKPVNEKRWKASPPGVAGREQNSSIMYGGDRVALYCAAYRVIQRVELGRRRAMQPCQNFPGTVGVGVFGRVALPKDRESTTGPAAAAGVEGLGVVGAIVVKRSEAFVPPTVRLRGRFDAAYQLWGNVSWRSAPVEVVVPPSYSMPPPPVEGG